MLVFHATSFAQLLDMCRRMDAMETNGFSGPDEEKEVALLRVLMSVSKA